MSIFRYLTAFMGRGASIYAPMAACLAGLVVLVGCVSNSTLPSQNVGVLLSPEEGQQSQGADKLETKLAISASQETTAPTPALSPAVKSALIPTNATATPSQTAVTGIAKPTAKKSTPLFGSLFSNNSRSSLRVDKQPASAAAKPSTQAAAASKNSNTKLAALPAKPLRQRETKRRAPRIKATLRDGAIGLPGVRIKKLFGIDTQETEEFDEPLDVANVPNLARRGTHGLLLQRPGVKVGCFPRKLVRLLKRVERRFGRTPIVTSGYRSPSYNRRVRGARNSTHVSCRAADIQVKGVSKWTLAKYLRTIPGRGGVGTYCHTRSVHIDIGKKRAWHYCKRSRKKRRRS